MALFLPDRASTSCSWTIRLPRIHSFCTLELAMIFATALWMKPFTPLAIDPERLDSKAPSLASPRCDNWAATVLVRCRTSIWLLIAVLILSVTALRMAGSRINGETFATYRSVLETWFALHTAITEIGARTQPSTMSSVARGPRQPIRFLGIAPAVAGRPVACLAASAARSATSAA